ncbi:MAG TPA: hypothetical protein VEH84_01585 [Alphaproteobacteria bacterium]|nr:hypothetical protein [Alphaproteobacteria bacterium]
MAKPHSLSAPIRRPDGADPSPRAKLLVLLAAALGAWLFWAALLYALSSL